MSRLESERRWHTTDILAGRAATFSKGPEFWSGDPNWQMPALAFGYGAYIVDIAGNEYLDWVSGLGAVILGYPNGECSPAADQWARQIVDQVWRGAGFSLPHCLERSVAEQLTYLLSTHVPGWKSQLLGLRWGKTGSDACAMAVRLARAMTGRQRILSVGYHGWHSEFVSTTLPAWGVVHPQHVEAIPYGDLHALTERFSTQVEPVAAVIIEHPPQSVPDGSYWQDISVLCNEHHALLILDEVVTGLRYALGGVAERFSIEPDLICMGKALGNGMPISCIVGRREYFGWFSRNDPVFISSTNFGDAVSLAACEAVLACWNQAAVDHIWQIGTELMVGLQAAGYIVTGYPPVSLIQHLTLSHRAFFIREMAARSILMNRPNIPNLAHTSEDVQRTVEAAREVARLADATDVEREMAGKLPQSLFSRR